MYPDPSTQGLAPVLIDTSPETSRQQISPLNVDNLRLYHHYITVTSFTFGDDVMWHDKIPRFAFDNSYIPHLMLALSALHLARLQAMEATKY